MQKSRDMSKYDRETKRKFEWDTLPEEEREIRRIVARGQGICPKCIEPLWTTETDKHSKGSCTMCCEFPDNPRAPMHRVKRILEFASLSESEWRIREAEAIARREANLSTWCTKGDDGIWRRKDNGQVWDAK
jgi:hypothetical protein